MIEIKVINDSNFELPKYKTIGAAGMDIQAYIDDSIVIKPLERILVSTGLRVAIPEGYEGQIRPRSGLAIKYGISVLNSPGTIDPDFRGTIKVILVNLSNEDYTINPGDRIAQIIFNKYEISNFKEVEKLDDTDRGKGGFGHTGV